MKILFYYISSFLLGCCLISCSTPSQPANGASLLQAERRYASLKRTFGEVTSPGLKTYFDYLLARLGADYSAGSTITVSVLRSKESFAFVLPGGRIAISSGLMTSLASEGELAFILAHEIAHLELKHFESSPRKNIWQREHAADIYAVKLMWSRGYDPAVAQMALLQSYFHTFTPAASNGTHPDIRSRQSVIQQEIKKLGRRPLGSIESHQFREIQRRLRQRVQSPPRRG